MLLTYKITFPAVCYLLTKSSLQVPTIPFRVTRTPRSLLQHSKSSLAIPEVVPYYLPLVLKVLIVILIGISL